MRILHPQFRDENRDSRYPFTDSSSLTTTDGNQLDVNWLLDALIYPPSVSGSLSVTAIFIDGATLTITISLTATGDTVCTGTINLENGPDGTIALVDTYGRPAGLLLADPTSLTALRQYAVGEVDFNLGDAEFVASVVVPSPEPGVRNFADVTHLPLAGDVWLVGENGVQLTQTDDNMIRVDVVGEPLFVRLTCANTATFASPVFLKTINGIPPTSWGGFTLQVGRVLSTKPALRIYVDDTGAIVIALALP